MDTPHVQTTNEASLRRAPVAALPVLVVVALAALEAWRSSGSIVAAGSHGWLPLAILTGLLAVAVLLSGAAVRPSRGTVAALVLLLALAVWAAAGLWRSPLPSLARDEGLLTAYYALALAVPVLTLRRASDRLTALAAVTSLLAAFALAVAATLAFGAHPLSHFSGGRLYFPITYANAQGAFFAAGFWPAVLLAAQRRGPVALRVGASGAAAGLLAATTLTQSKGAVIGLAAALLALVCVSPARLRLLVPAAIALVIDVVAFRPLTAPFRQATETAARHAGLAVLLATTAGLVLGAVYVALDRRLEIGASTRVLIGRVTGALAVLAVVAGLAAFFVAVPHPGRWLDARWSSFKHLKANETGSSHFVNLGSNRYDYWRVALHEFERHPVAGCGARCFGPEYLLLRHSHESPARAHSLPLEVLAEQGVIGFALLAAALALLFTALVRLSRSRNAVATAALGTGTCWLVHSLVDWIWTFPAVTATALAIVGIGVAQSDVLLQRRAARASAALVAAIVVLAFTPVALAGWLTEHDRDLSLARRLDPVSTAPVIAAAVHARTADEEVALLRKASRMEPRVAATQYFLGVAYLNLGRRAEARVQLRRALRLDPGNPSIRHALRLAQ